MSPCRISGASSRALRAAVSRVDGGVGGAEAHAVAGGPVQHVVDPLGHAEECGRPRDHHPARVESRAACVGE